MKLKNEFLAVAAVIAMAAATGSAYSQAEKKDLGVQGGAKIEAQGQTGGAKVQGQGGAQTGGSSTQMQTQGGAKTGQEAQRPGQAQKPAEESPSRQQAQPSGEKPAQLSETQRTQISTTISKQSNLRRVERNSVNFTINVGAVVPRTVNLVALPAPIVAVVPAYRGYLYIVVGDDLLIVHPRTYEIVAVIPA